MALILDAFVGAVVDKLALLVEEKVAVVLGVKDELRRLQQKMEMIRSVLDDAERQRIHSKLVADWVRNLKDVLYDADDIIDLCRCEAANLLADQASSSSNPPSKKCCSFRSFASLCCSVPFRHEIGNRIEELNQRFKDINDGMSSLNLLQNNPEVPAVTQVDIRQTSSVPEADLVGEDIKNATRDLVQLMLQQGENITNPQVTAVVGMGGIGKTTLAQNIFNHQQIQAEFSNKIWVCISQNYSESNLLAEIIEGAGGSAGGATTKAQLLPLLRGAVSGKRFFLVLDDVWRADVWDDLLRNPLQSAAIGSRVLVTTRDRNVANGMGAQHIRPVDKLSTESGWQLLCKRLFANSEDEDMQRLKDTGIKIVEKCDGLPLAVKTVAGVLMRKNRSETEWQRVLTNEIWSMNRLPKELMGAMYLSYEDLSSELKQCFLFCSLFEEDSKIYASDVVNYWIVEGFIDTKEEYFVEKAYDHLKELDERNLIQKDHSSTNKMYDDYKMHDVLRSMAQFLSRNESFCGRTDELAAIPSTTKLRRLNIIDQEESEVSPQLLLRQKSLRTLFFRSCPRSGISQLLALPLLRILVLSYSAIEDVPDAVGDLIHLRLLDLSWTKISSLPESMRKLTNLQFLKLWGCNSLHTLPKAITELSNLWHLELGYRPLQFIPAGIGRLERLNVFDKFIVGEDLDEQQGQGCRLEELKPLKQLIRLHVEHLERAAVGSKEGGEQQLLLGDKRHLKHLELRCSRAGGVTGEEEMIHKIEEVFTQLAPPQGMLEILVINGYFGRSFPNWMMSSSSLGSFLGQLTKLSFIDCINIQELPPLGTLPQLRSLVIWGARGVVRMGREFLGSNPTSSSTTVFFPRLEELHIKEMSNLEEWWVFPGEEEESELIVFPNLHSLEISYCPKLERLPSALKQSPTKHLVVKRSGLREIRNFPCLTELHVSGCESLESICDLPAVRKLNIISWPSLKCVEYLDGLRRLFLDDRGMESLPEWLLGLLQQRQLRHEDDDFSLELRCNEDLLKRCLEGCEHWPIIQDIPRVSAASYSSGAKKYMKCTRKPFSYETNL